MGPGVSSNRLLASATVDRLRHNAYCLVLDGRQDARRRNCSIEFSVALLLIRLSFLPLIYLRNNQTVLSQPKQQLSPQHHSDSRKLKLVAQATCLLPQRSIVVDEQCSYTLHFGT
jgi:hypothetical protein